MRLIFPQSSSKYADGFYRLPILFLVTSLVALFWIWLELEGRYQQRLTDHFNFETQRIADNIRERIALHGQALRSAAGLFSGSDNVTRDDWRAFVEMLELDQNFPGVQGMGFSLWIPPTELQRHIESTRQQGFPHYVVTPIADRDAYSSIVFLEPFSGRNLRAFGYDMYSEPTRRKAMEHARDHGELAYSGKVTLVQETQTDPQAGLLAYFPVYRNGSIPQTLDQRRSALLGWVYSPYRMDDLLAAVLGNQLQALRLEIFDIDRIDQEGLLYDSLPASTSPELKPTDKALHRIMRLDLGGRYWTLRFTTMPQFSKTAKFEAPWVEESGLLLIGLLLLSITWAYSRAQRNATLAIQLSDSLKHSESRFRQLFENSPVAYLAFDQRGVIVDANPQLCDLLGHEMNLLLGRQMIDLIDSKDQESVAIKLQTLNHYGILKCEINVVQQSGHEIAVILDGRLQKLSHNQTITHCILTNITERKHAEDKLHLAARVFNEAHEGITISDTDSKIIDVNPTFCAMTGYRRSELLGKDHSILRSGQHDDAFYADIWRRLLADGMWQGEIWNKRKNGDLFAALLSISALRDQSGAIINFVSLFTEITETKMQQQALEDMAHHDPLTQLPNRILFADRFRQALARCKREMTTLGLVYMDLDGFKQVNDNLGHDIGDLLLQEVSTRIKSCLREEDTVARLGGDEFALLLNDLESKNHCTQILQRVHGAIAQPYQIMNTTIQIGVSSGVTLYPDDPSDADFLLRHADQAMYQAKQRGRNRFEFYRHNGNP